MWPGQSTQARDGMPTSFTRLRSQRFWVTVAGPEPSSRHRAVRKKRIFRHVDEIVRKLMPAAPRCRCCAQAMRLTRKTPRFGGLPDLYTFECRSCETSHVEEGGPARWRDTGVFRLFRKQARECRRLATLAQDSDDHSFWLRLSDHWLKLAQDADR